MGHYLRERAAAVVMLQETMLEHVMLKSEKCLAMVTWIEMWLSRRLTDRVG